MDSLCDMPGHLIRRAHQISTALFAEECAGFDLTPVQYAALVAIKANPEVDATRLSALIAFDRSTIGGVLERLEAKGWVALLGDAAHIHSPMGAQGMNTGLQDAYNLAWKLALVVKGEAHASLLDSYEAERRPVAQRLLRTTDRAFMLVVSETRLAAAFRTDIVWRIASLAMRRGRIRRAIFRAISQIGTLFKSSAYQRHPPRFFSIGSNAAFVKTPCRAGFTPVAIEVCDG